MTKPKSIMREGDFSAAAWVAEFVGQWYNKKLSYRQEAPDG